MYNAEGFIPIAFKIPYCWRRLSAPAISTLDKFKIIASAIIMPNTLTNLSIT